VKNALQEKTHVPVLPKNNYWKAQNMMYLGWRPTRAIMEEYQKGLRKILICTFMQSKFASKEMVAFVISHLILSSLLAAAKASALCICIIYLYVPDAACTFAVNWYL
jgi:hypothetical protein